MNRPYKIADVSTPALLLDEAKLTANIARVADRADSLGILLRPHVKTPKSVEVARRLLARAASGITVSTLREAEYFGAHGLADQFYATALAPQKVPRVAALMASGVDLRCVIDSAEGARALAGATASLSRPIPVLVELNIDDYRAGLRFDSEEFAVSLEAITNGAGLRFAGLMTYAGASYHTPPDERADLAERHRTHLVSAASILAERGIDCPVRSFGSTPAFMRAATMAGVSEIRGGIYVFQDLFQAGIEACVVDDIALTVATTVISHQPALNRMFIDAGGLALSKDRSTAGHAFDAAFGLVAGADGVPIDDLWVETVHQELGVVTTRSGRPLNFKSIPVGTILRILPNHADMTAAAYDKYHVVRGVEVVDIWGRENGW